MTTLLLNISAPKTGTTALFHSLVRSRYISAPKIKEPCFFMDRDGPILPDLPPRLNLRGRNHLGVNWFHRLYGNNGRYHVDFSTFYSASLDTPALTFNYDPKAKLILIHRDPVARFLSNYFHFKKTGIPLPSLEETISIDSAFRRYLLLFADYSGTYHRYLARFPAVQIFTARFEDMVGNPDQFSTELSRFLEVDDFRFQPRNAEKNASGRPKSLMLQRFFLGKHMSYLSALAPLSPRVLLETRRKIVRWNTKPVKNTPPDARHIQMLRDLLAPQYAFLDKHYNEEVKYAA